MTTAQLFLLNTWLGIVSAWLIILWAQLRIRRQGLILSTRSDQRDLHLTLPSLGVIIPARNEEETIEQCLRSVLSQDYPNVVIRVVNDRSTDGTAAVLEHLAREHSNLTVHQVDDVPSGWLGKSNALWQGTRDLRTDWLLFLDSDCRLAPGALRTAMAHALEHDAELLSLWPRQAPGDFWEHMLIPLCGAIIAMWFGSHKVNDQNTRKAFANGQFLMIRREAYENIGGHRSVRNAIIEDVPLAEHAKARGVRCRVASGLNLVSVRMYTGFKAICNGWSRIYIGALRSGMRITLSILWLVFGSLLPYIALAALAWVGMAFPNMRSLFFWSCAALATIHLLLMMIVSYRFWGMGGCPRRYLWLYPISVLIVIGILGRAWWNLIVHRRVAWRSVTYAIDRRGCIVQ